MTEAEWIAAAQAGDTAAFTRLMEQHQGKIYNLVFRMVGNPEDAADLTQETFLNAWKGLRRFRVESSFSTWLYRLASNVCIDFLRREKKRNVLSLSVPDDEDNREVEIPDERWSPERAFAQQEAKSSLQKGLLALSPEHRQVLLLRELEGLSYAEIAACLHLEPGTVKSRLARARLALRALLTEEM